MEKWKFDGKLRILSLMKILLFKTFDYNALCNVLKRILELFPLTHFIGNCHFKFKIYFASFMRDAKIEKQKQILHHYNFFFVEKNQQCQQTLKCQLSRLFMVPA